MADLKVNVGEPIPSVGLRATDGYLLNLRSFVTKQPSVLFFFGAPTLSGRERDRGEALVRAFRDGYRRLTDAGIGVVGITCDSERQQSDFSAWANLPFLLFSDERRTAAEMLGVPTSADGDNVNAARVVLCVAKDGKLAAALDDPDPRTLVDEVIGALVPGEPAEATATPSPA